MRMPRTLAITCAAITILAAACGGDDDAPSDASRDDAVRTVEVEMTDIAFEPDSLDVEHGETIRFVFTNTGKVAHDAFIGDADAQAEHEAEMRGGDDGHGGEHGDDEADAVTVAPGDTAELTHTFGETGSVEVGCHQPGHYDAGMTIEVSVG